ncbi:MAG TPA: hypothetical protein DEB40_06300, partial [Elusimicrobia bacterium]|nr:hypothetical protein [Elusimicrobiota bacterium]
LAGNWGPITAMSFTFNAVPRLDQLTLKDNYFNAARGGCMTLDVQATSSGHLKAEIYNYLGQRVASLVNEDIGTGVQSVSWCGKNSSSQLVATGVYILHVEAPNQKKDFKIFIGK